MNSGNSQPIIKQIDEVERHISEYEQEIDELQKQYSIPAEWFTEDFDPDTSQSNYHTHVIPFLIYNVAFLYHKLLVCVLKT